MATTSIALMTQPLSKLPITFAETESAKGGLFGVGTIPTGPEAVSLELSTAVTQFSLLLNEASESSSSALAAPAPVDSSDVLMPQTFQTDAYDLVTLDGKELPFLGNFLPQAISEEDFLDLSSLNMASPSSGPTILDSESAQMPVTTVSDNSASSVAAASEIEIALLTANPSLLVEDKLGEVTGAPEPTNKMTNKSDSLGAALSKLAAEVEKRAKVAA